jgi:Mg2+ and Co2+ transporter CorA
MVLYDITEKIKHVISNNSEIEPLIRDKKDHKFFLICQNSQIKLVEDYIDIDNAYIDQAFSSQDQYVNYVNYDAYDFLSVMLISNTNVHTIIKVFFSENFLILSTPDGIINADIAWIHQYVDQRIAKFFKADITQQLNEALGFIFYNIFASIVRFFSQTLEDVEDKIELFITKLSTDEVVNNKYLKHIELIRKLSYSIRKHIRALDTITGTIEQNENQFFPKTLNHLLRSIKRRVDAILKFSESVYSFSEELIVTYNSKITNQTNILVMRLTS